MTVLTELGRGLHRVVRFLFVAATTAALVAIVAVVVVVPLWWFASAAPVAYAWSVPAIAVGLAAAVVYRRIRSGRTRWRNVVTNAAIVVLLAYGVPAAIGGSTMGTVVLFAGIVLLLLRAGRST